VVIVGAGFAGITAAIELGRDQRIEQQPCCGMKYLSFTPMSGGERRGEAAALPGWIAEGNQLDDLLLPLEPGPGSHGLDRRRRLAALSDLVGSSRSADRASGKK
jgi:hypothetical protein